jgi:hypothetical protein
MCLVFCKFVDFSLILKFISLFLNGQSAILNFRLLCVMKTFEQFYKQMAKSLGFRIILSNTGASSCVWLLS